MSERAVTDKVATIGVDVGGTSISGGLVRHDGEVLATDQQHHGRHRHDCHQRGAETRRATAVERGHIDRAGVEFADQ